MTAKPPVSPSTQHPLSIPLEPLLTLKEVAALLRVSIRTVQRLIDSGAMPCVRIGRQVRLRRTDVQQRMDG